MCSGGHLRVAVISFPLLVFEFTERMKRVWQHKMMAWWVGVWRLRSLIQVQGFSCNIRGPCVWVEPEHASMPGHGYFEAGPLWQPRADCCLIPFPTTRFYTDNDLVILITTRKLKPSEDLKQHFLWKRLAVSHSAEANCKAVQVDNKMSMSSSKTPVRML